MIFLESSCNAKLSLILEWQRGKECEHRAKTLKRSPKKAASSEAGSKKELYGIPRREIPKKRGAIGPASRRRMPVLVSGASFACNFVRGSYLEVRVTTSQPVPGGCCSLWPASLFISYIVDELHSVVSVRIARTQRGTREIMPREQFFVILLPRSNSQLALVFARFGNDRVKMTSYRTSKGKSRSW